jgi:hypothetical protein
MRKPKDKSSGVFDHNWPSLFNAVIESLDLREIVMTDRQYTWAGSRDNPTFEKLDRVLAKLISPLQGLKLEIETFQIIPPSRVHRRFHPSVRNQTL